MTSKTLRIYEKKYIPQFCKDTLNINYYKLIRYKMHHLKSCSSNIYMRLDYISDQFIDQLSYQVKLAAYQNL